jgi:hypothetical protein
MKNIQTNRGFTLIEVLVSFGLLISFVGFILLLTFLKLDWVTGEHGRLTITAVDKNLFGTHTIYARNSESLSGVEANEITYCIDANDTEIAKQAKEAIGKKNTTLIYPEKRIGFMLLDKCHSAPIKEIKLSEEEIIK